MKIPYWLLRFLPRWEWICPKCRKAVKANSHQCPHCGEKYPFALKIPPTFLKDKKKLETYVHEHVFPRISKFERNYLTQFFTTFFTDGFESGGFGAWSGYNAVGSGSHSISSSVKHSGTYSANFSITSASDSAYCYEFLNGATGDPTVYTQAYAYFDSLPNGASDWFTIIRLLGSSAAVEVGVLASSGTLYWFLYRDSSGQQQYSTPAITTGTWYCLQILRDNTNQMIGLWVNGTELENESHGVYDNTFTVSCGLPYSTSVSSAFDIYIDDVTIADTLISTSTFAITSVSVSPGAVQRGVTPSTLTVNWTDPADLGAGNYQCLIYTRSSDAATTYGPFTAIVTRVSAGVYQGNYAWTPLISAPACYYSLRAEVSEL